MPVVLEAIQASKDRGQGFIAERSRQSSLCRFDIIAFKATVAVHICNCVVGNE